MIQLMLVDDDALFRARLRGMTGWGAHGIRIMAEARNGREAIEQISRQKPDIILTDVSMPVLDGVGLIDYVNRYHADIPIVALSAYDDFQFVRDCLKSGAQDYLLKHELGEERLFSMLEDVVRKFHIRGEPREAGHDWEEFFFLALSGWFQSAAQLTQRAAELRVALPSQGVYPMILSPDGDVKTEISDAMFGMLGELTASVDATPLRLTPDRVFVLYPASVEKWPSEPYRCGIQLVIDNFHRFFDVSLSVGVGDLLTDIASLPAEYRKACDRYEAAEFSGKHAFIASRDEAPAALPACLLEAREEQALASLLVSGEEKALSETLLQLFDKLQASAFAAKDLTFVYAGMVSVLLHTARKHGVEMDSETIPQLASFHRLDDLRKWMLEHYLLLQNELHRNENQRYGTYTCTAIEYMKKHYHERVTLQGVAKMLNLNASYLSRLFKAETGSNLMPYLNDLRITEAERLLANRELPIKYIAEQVGIQNYNHFFTLFRKTTGLTPNEFRQRQ